MSWSRTWAIALRIIRQFRRDRRTIGLLFIVPIAILTILGPLIGTETTIRLGLSNRDQGVTLPGRPAPPGRPARPPVEKHLSEPLVESLKDASRLDVTTLSRAEIDRRLKAGRLDGALLIGEDFSRDVAAGKRPKLTIKLEGSDPSMNAEVSSQIQKRLGEADTGGAPRLTVSYFYGGSNLDTLDYFAPVFIAFFVFFFVFLLTSVSFLRERGRGTIERLMASPVSRAEVMAGYLIGFFIFAAVQSVVILAYTMLVLKARFAGSLAGIFLIEMLLTAGSVNLGIFLSSFARSELQVVQFIPIVVTPQALLSGMIWPIRSMPRVLQWLAALMPLTYANRALRALMIKGLPLSAVRSEVAFLIGFAVAMMVLSALTIKREIA